MTTWKIISDGKGVDIEGYEDFRLVVRLQMMRDEAHELLNKLTEALSEAAD